MKCDNKLGAIEEIGWSKVDVMGIVWWKGGNVSWQSIQIITISIFDYDTHQCFDDDETARPNMLIHINEHIFKPHSQMRVAWFCRVYFRSHNGGFFQWFYSALKALKKG